MRFVRRINMYASKYYFTTKGCAEHGNGVWKACWYRLDKWALSRPGECAN
jgi:hypothetical protein